MLILTFEPTVFLSNILKTLFKQQHLHQRTATFPEKRNQRSVSTRRKNEYETHVYCLTLLIVVKLFDSVCVNYFKALFFRCGNVNFQSQSALIPLVGYALVVSSYAIISGSLR